MTVGRLEREMTPIELRYWQILSQVEAEESGLKPEQVQARRALAQMKLEHKES